MSQLIAPLQRLGTEIERMAYAADRTGGDARRRRRMSSGARRRSLVIALVLGLLFAAAAAIAATSGWLTGDPVKERPGMTFKSDVGLGKVISGSARLAALRVADPDGGPPWGIRTLHTTRQLGCVQVGRVVDGKLGVLGHDGAFGNDGKFHELPPGVLSQSQCAPLDDAGNAFIAISYSGIPAGGLREGCAARVPKQLLGAGGRFKQPHRGHPPTVCPRSDLRNVLYGTLGPQGKAITYRDPATGRVATRAADGPDHAYLVVARPTAEHPATGNWFTLQTPGSGLIAVDYRDGSTCHVVSARRAGGARPCPAKGLVIAPLTAAQLRAPVSVAAAAKLERPLTGPPGDRRAGPAARRVSVGFRAPIATPDARSYYVVSLMLGPAAAHRCRFAGMSGPLARSVHAGETVRKDFWIPPGCHAAVGVTVALHRQGTQPDVGVYAGGRTPADDAIVGHATLKLP